MVKSFISSLSCVLSLSHFICVVLCVSLKPREEEEERKQHGFNETQQWISLRFQQRQEAFFFRRQASFFSIVKALKGSFFLNPPFFLQDSRFSFLPIFPRLTMVLPPRTNRCCRRRTIPRNSPLLNPLPIPENAAPPMLRSPPPPPPSLLMSRPRPRRRSPTVCFDYCYLL